MAMSGCKYLDVVPDNVATINNAFAMRSTAEKYLFTCYSYLPQHAAPYAGNPAITSGDEIWFYSYITGATAWNVALGRQNVVNPYVNYWDGLNGGTAIFNGLRDCNIFLENIDKVRDMDDYEKKRWSGEVKFLKAYYHFWLLRMYGPIPIVDKNIPISASVDEVRVSRRPIDECVSYITGLLDEAAVDLPPSIQQQVEEMGRVTRPAALALKARVLVTAASPMYNGNTDYASLRNINGETLFNPVFEQSKWEIAAKACQEAITLCHEVGNKLYYFNDSQLSGTVSEETKTELNIRAALSIRWNPEIIWGNANSRAFEIQSRSQPRVYRDEGHLNATESTMAPPIKIAEMFYSSHGVPITEDNTWDFPARYNLRTATADDRLYIKEGSVSINLHFNREPRFYASLGFDAGRWYGQGRYTDNDNFYIDAKAGGVAAGHVYKQSITGYWPKKLVNYLNVASPTGYSVQSYPWPVIRMSDLYLLCAEALNESAGPTPEAFKWINMVRARAGLNTVEQSWTEYSRQPGKYTTKEGLRDIIQQERLIELAFEGHRFWDLRRWKRAEIEMNKPIMGWSLEESDPAAYYKPRLLFNQEFKRKDYLWPIKESTMIVNRNLIQNPGW